MKYSRQCRDCNYTFTTGNEQQTKCEFCLERDQYYTERAIQDELRDRIEEDENVNV
jgi:hypothetical protein